MGPPSPACPRNEASGSPIVYESHFGMGLRPFSETVSDSAYLSLPSRETALRRLKYGLVQAQGPVVLFGPSGSGKTLLARKLAAEFSGPAAILSFPLMPAAELIAFLADALEGRNHVSTGTGSLLTEYRRLESILAARSARGESSLFIVDEAQSIEDPSLFESLRMLLNLSSRGTPDLSLMFVGTSEVLLRLPASLADRLTAQCVLGPLSEAEAAAYLEGRLAAAGSNEPLFSPEAVAELHRSSDGLPRRLNRIADLALLIAYAEESARCDARIVSIAARELGFDQAA